MMKKLMLLIASFFCISSAYALPECPADIQARWHNCQGTYTWADGHKYVGEYRDEKMHGQGTYTFADGDKYVGEFRDDEKHGQGTYTYGSQSQWAGHTAIGEFKDDSPVFPQTYIFPDGSRRVGRIVGDEFIQDFSVEELRRVALPIPSLI